MNKTARGLIAILISALFYATYGVWTRLMAGSFGEFNQAWPRALFVLMLLVPFGLATGAYRPVSRKES